MIKTRLKIRCVSEIVGNEEMCLLVLVDEDMQRQITIICDKIMGVQIDMRLKKLPLTRIMLPEVLCQFIKSQSDLEPELVIQNILDGQYIVSLCRKDLQDPIPIRASDAVLLSVVGDIPLYIDSLLMARQSVIYKKNSVGISIPVNTLSDEMLQSALDKAIDNENYELASHLHDEKKRRERSASNAREGLKYEGD